jgi:hypothetical protein
MKRASLSLIAAAALLLPVPARADYPQSLRELHQKAVGYTFGDGIVRTLQFLDVSEVAKNGEVRVRTEASQIGMVYRHNVEDIEAKNGYSNGFTGNVFWYSDENGFTVQAKGTSAQLAFDDQLIQCDAVATLPWTLVRMDRLDGKDVAVVRVEPKGTFPLELYVDTQSGLYRQIAIDPKGDYESIVHVLDYADVDGKKFMSRFRFDGSEAIHVRSDFTVNPIISDAQLHPPATTAQWQFGDGSPLPIEIKHDRVLLDATINGVQGRFMLDTGASNILLSGKFARRAGLKALGHARVIGPDIGSKVDSGRVDTLQIGGSILHNALVYFGTEELDEYAPDGLLGFDVFAGSVVTLDVKKL